MTIQQSSKSSLKRENFPSDHFEFVTPAQAGVHHKEIFSYMDSRLRGNDEMVKFSLKRARITSYIVLAFLVAFPLQRVAGKDAPSGGNGPTMPSGTADSDKPTHGNASKESEKNAKNGISVSRDNALKEISERFGKGPIGDKLREFMDQAQANGDGFNRVYLDDLFKKADTIQELMRAGRDPHLNARERAAMIARIEQIRGSIAALGPFERPVIHWLGDYVKGGNIHSKDFPAHFLDRLVETARNYTRRHPNDPFGYQALGDLYSKMRHWKESRDNYDAAWRLNTPDKDTLLRRRMRVSYHMGDYKRANEDARELLKGNPGDPVALAMLELTAARVGAAAATANAANATAAAVANPSLAAPIQPTPVVSAPSYAPSMAEPPSMTYTNQGELQSAHQAKLAAAALTLKDYDVAIEQANRAIESNPNNAQAYNYRAMALFYSGEDNAALADVDHALRLLPKNRVSTNTKAYLLNAMERYQDAETTLEEAGFGANSNDPDSLYNRAYSLAGLNDRGAMLDALQRAANLDSGRFNDVYQMAIETPQGADLRYLFGGENATRPRSARPAIPQAASTSRVDQKFLLIVLATLIGGLLMAYGFAHILRPASIPVEAGLAGAYKLLRPIGSGGMGTVYEALDLKLGRRVAIKKMRAEIREDTRERQRFLKEARTVAALHHPNIVDIYGIIEDANELSLIFEYVDGRDLHHLVTDEGPLSFAQARTIFEQVCNALEYAHRNHVIHRDLKPSNIMIAHSGAAKVMDFGIAREVKDAVSRLMTNTIVGTPPYMAPEAEVGRVGKETDVYALGVCLYEILSGEVPFGGMEAGMRLNKMNMNFTPLTSRVSGLPEGIDLLIERALHPEPTNRIKTPAEFLARLNALVMQKASV